MLHWFEHSKDAVHNQKESVDTAKAPADPKDQAEKAHDTAHQDGRDAAKAQAAGGSCPRTAKDLI